MASLIVYLLILSAADAQTNTHDGYIKCVILDGAQPGFSDYHTGIGQTKDEALQNAIISCEDNAINPYVCEKDRITVVECLLIKKLCSQSMQNTVSSDK